jgi:integrase
LEYELALGDLHVASKLPLPVILEAFCKELMATRTYKSYKNDFSRLRIFFGPICEILEPGIPGVKRHQKKRSRCFDKYAGEHVKAQLLEDISAQVINRFIAARVQKDGWSAKTANLMRQTLHRLFSYAIKHHGFHSRDRRYPNPADGTERKREPAHNIRFLKLDEIDVQLQVLAEYPVIHAMVAVYIYAGLRREEATWLTYDDVDVSNRLIRVQAKTVSGDFWQPKTKRNRVVPISDALNGILNNYVPPTNSIWFFPSPRGKKWDPDNFSQDLRKINKAAGLNWSCLDFRHTFGSHLAQKGESLYKIAELMGNSPEICRRHYAALVPEKMTDVVEFSIEGKGATKDSEMKKMFKEILDELKGQKRAGGNTPHLKLVHFDDSA